jgi:acyl-CoA thioester hydrolase
MLQEPENKQASATEIYSHEFTVPESAVDMNGHVNNVVYVQWMQDVAVRHSDAVEGTQAMHAAGGTWVVRSHRIEYLSPAFAGEVLIALTWVANFRRVGSLRRHKFYRKKDNRLLAKGETEWVFVDAERGRPRTVPDAVKKLFPLVAEEDEP